MQWNATSKHNINEWIKNNYVKKTQMCEYLKWNRIYHNNINTIFSEKS